MPGLACGPNRVRSRWRPFGRPWGSSRSRPRCAWSPGGGDVAAEIACASVLHGFAAAPGLESGRLRHLVEQANRDVVARQTEGGRLAAMRSTVVLAVVDLHANELAWTHTGDSRAYLF